MRETHIVWDKVVAKDLDLDAETFSAMKSGIYKGWSAEENKRRGGKISNVLSRARASVEPEVWKKILELGLGNVQAQDITFDKIGDEIQDQQRITIHKLPPSLSALQMWLRHHSQMYRSIESGKVDEEENADIPKDIDHGVDIVKWIDKEVSENSND